MKNIGAIRGVFDPPHKWHISWIEAAYEQLRLDHIRVIVKFIWEKNPALSVKERVRLLRLGARDIGISLDITVQNVNWHVHELLDMESYYWNRPVQICWSDKIEKEMQVYWKRWDNFWVIERVDFPNIACEGVATSLWINLTRVTPRISTSSTVIRNWIRETGSYPDSLLWISLAAEICEKWYYQDRISTLMDLYFKGWEVFKGKILSEFPSMELSNIQKPLFISNQSIDGWEENYVRHLIREIKLEGNELYEVIRFLWLI